MFTDTVTVLNVSHVTIIQEAGYFLPLVLFTLEDPVIESINARCIPMQELIKGHNEWINESIIELVHLKTYERAIELFGMPLLKKTAHHYLSVWVWRRLQVLKNQFQFELL
jgi:hypothetical protein